MQMEAARGARINTDPWAVSDSPSRRRNQLEHPPGLARPSTPTCVSEIPEIEESTAERDFPEEERSPIYVDLDEELIQWELSELDPWMPMTVKDTQLKRDQW